MTKILQEPLLHFLLGGVLIFIYFSFTSPNVKDELIISKGKIHQLKSQFEKTRQRPATEKEVQALIQDELKEELAFKRGQEMGLVENDSIIKRRVRQKLEFLLEDSISSLNPSDIELQDYLNTHKDLFVLEPGYSFKQIYIDPNKHLELDSFILALQKEDLDKVYADRGDMIMLQNEYENISSSQISRLFGQKFSESLDEIRLEKWIKIRSGYGLHLVNINKKSEMKIASLKEAKQDILRAYQIEQQDLAIEKLYKELSSQYKVIIEEEG